MFASAFWRFTKMFWLALSRMAAIKKKVLIVSPQAARIGHGAFHGQRLLTALNQIDGYDIIFLTGKGFRERVPGQPLYGEIVEAPVDMSPVGGFKNAIESVQWGIKRRVLFDQLLGYIDGIIEKYDIDIVFMLDGDVSSIYSCWKRIKKKYPEVGWVIAHSLVDFHFSGFSVRSLFKWWVSSKVKEMAESMGATVLFLGQDLRDQFCEQLGLSRETRERVVLTHFGADPEDMRLPRSDARTILQIPNNAHVALFFGLIRKDKRPDIAIKAVANAPVHWWLLIAGMPYSYSSKDIHHWIREAGIQERSRLILEYLSEDQIRSVFSAANVLLMTHDHPLAGSSGPLAMCRSFRLPAIVSNNRYFGKIIAQDGVGFLAAVGNDQDFSDQLRGYDQLSEDQLAEIELNIAQAAEKYSFLETAKDCANAFEISYNFMAGQDFE